jgi:hypothetical protein
MASYTSKDTNEHTYIILRTRKEATCMVGMMKLEASPFLISVALPSSTLRLTSSSPERMVGTGALGWSRSYRYQHSCEQTLKRCLH